MSITSMQIIEVMARRGSLLLVIGSVAFILSLGLALERVAPAQHDRSWEPLRLNAVYAEYGSFAELVAESTVVVVGSITSVAPGRKVGGDSKLGERDTVYYLSAILEIEEVLHGAPKDPTARTVTLELFAPNIDAAEAILANPPRDRGLFFLINKADHVATVGLSADRRRLEEAYYEAAWPEGVIVERAGTAVPVGAIESDDFLVPWRGKPFGELVQAVRAVR